MHQYSPVYMSVDKPLPSLTPCPEFSPMASPEQSGSLALSTNTRTRTPANDPYHIPLARHDSLVTMASDTAPNLPGHGRTLDRIYTSLGTRVEGLMSKLEEIAGNTPHAKKKTIEVVFEAITGLSSSGCCRGYARWDASLLTGSERAKIQKSCKSLLKHTK